MNSDYANIRSDTDTRILIVDDEPHIRSMLLRALNLVGYHAQEAGSGEEALALLELNSYDVMILDLCMGDINGTDIMQRAYQLRPESLIIVLTGNASLESAITAIRSRAVDYLLKPASIHEVVEAVTNALQKRRARQDDFAHAVSHALDKLQKSKPFPTSPPDTLSPTRSMLVAPPLQLHRSKRFAMFLDKPERVIELTKGETEVLACLMLYPDHPLSCRRIARIAWKYDIEKAEAASLVRPYISRLRHKIESNPKNPCLIRTVRRRGYKFVRSEGNGAA